MSLCLNVGIVWGNCRYMGGWRSKEGRVWRKWVYLFVCSYYYEEFWGNLIFWILIVTLGSFLHPSSVLRMGVGFSQCVRVLSVFTLDSRREQEGALLIQVLWRLLILDDTILETKTHQRYYHTASLGRRQVSSYGQTIQNMPARSQPAIVRARA